MQTTTVNEYSILKNFVSPNLCKELLQAGVDVPAPYFWLMIEGRSPILMTYEFDTDGYYRHGDRHIETIYKNEKLSAFSAAELEKCLPDFTISRNNGEYLICIDKHYPSIPVTAKRLPDLFAKMVLQLIKNRILFPMYINGKLKDG